MSHQRSLHQQAKRIFQEACEIEGAKQSEFLVGACAGNEELLAEVRSLLEYDDPELTESLGGTSNAPSSARQDAKVTVPSRRLARKHFTPTFFALCLLASSVFLLDRYCYSLALRDAEKQIASIRDTYALAVQSWVDLRRREVSQLAELPKVRELAARLAKFADGGAEPAEISSNPLLAEFYDAVLPYRQTHSNAAVCLVDTRGKIIADPNEDWIGIRINQHGYGYLAPVFEGQTVFIPPHAEGSFTLAFPSDFKRKNKLGVHSFIVGPIRDSQNKVVAILACAERSIRGLGRMLNGRTFGRTGEIYLFNRQGVMISRSRHADRAIPEGANDRSPSTESAMLTVKLQVPPAHVATNSTPEGAAAESRQTTIVAEALASQSSDDPAYEKGALLVPYLNYRAARVIGTWVWLPELDCGIIAECEATEAFSSNDRLRWILWGSSALLGLTLAGKSSVGYLRQLHRHRSSPNRIGKYELSEAIGEGGLGVVWRGVDTHLNREVALKFLKVSECTADTISRFHREVRLMSSLTHPNTVRIFDRGVTDSGVPFYVMEYLDGQTLAQFIALEGPLAFERGLRLFDQICSSVEEAHLQSAIHRDLKPENVMVCRPNRSSEYVKVLDYGLGKFLGVSEISQVTTGRQIAGTIRYMAPECISEPVLADTRADVYALGAVGYFLFSGKSIFDGQTELKTIYSILHADVDFEPLEQDQKFPTGLLKLLKQCLSKQADSRPQDASELRRRLAKSAGSPQI